MPPMIYRLVNISSYSLKCCKADTANLCAISSIFLSSRGTASATSKRHNSIASSLENDCGNGKFLFNPQCQNTDANAIGDGSALAPVGLQEGGKQTIINQEEEAPPVTPNPPPEEEKCNQATIGFVALYDVTMDADLGNLKIGDEICLSGNLQNPFGIQDAFDVTDPVVSGSPVRLLVLNQPANGCADFGSPPARSGLLL